ncbi:hypothetical protein AKJ09_11416 [Labilithrix luteola]|uniref:Knr4/Smi1-like domain-containing protein n=1 Tax=Labilithrix luteola TaxID=1391654 RepID=A0A0K1QGB3_9BACT|nr:SMI1/KNR4 family protein [Labilithrix luteola]AKV04753.1 hypothetical protein AKJ09_11416 [Labilithrix luteola]
MLRGDLLERFDEALKKLVEHAKGLRPGAKPADITTAERALEAKLPKTLAALYAWHDGEMPSGKVFDELCRTDVDASWDEETRQAFVVKFMTLAEVAEAGVTEAHFERATNSMWLNPIDEPSVTCKLVPFLWVRGGDPAEKREPRPDDWFVGVDDVSGAVWLYEPDGEDLEIVDRQAPALEEWLRIRTLKLEKLSRTAAAKAPSAVPVVRPPALLLLELLVEKGAIELSEDADIPSTAARLAPLLAQIPQKLAVKSAMTFLEEDDSIAEIFMDDDKLRKIVSQFTA